MVLTRVPVAVLLTMSGCGSNWRGKLAATLDQPDCRLIALVVHQELGVMPLKVPQLSYQDVLIEFDSTMDVEWAAQKLLGMEWWMGSLCHLE